MTWSLQIGPKTYPEGQPSSSIAETFSLLRQTIGTYDESVRTISIHDATYRDIYICTSWSGYPCAGGDARHHGRAGQGREAPGLGHLERQPVGHHGLGAPL